MADVRGTGPGSGGVREGRDGENWSRRIGEALERDLFVLHAQRIVDVASGETVRHELFLRMVDGERLIPAGEFVLAAEELGSIREIDRWVVGRAIEVAAAGHPVDLNLSVRSLDDALLELISHRTGETGADPGRSRARAERGAAGGRGRGGGAGSCTPSTSSVAGSPSTATSGAAAARALLNRLPIDFVKLGARFVSGLADDGRRRRKARNAAAKAHASGQRVIAQGVEDLVTLQLLQDLGIDEAQGYALGRPEPLESLIGAPA